MKQLNFVTFGSFEADVIGKHNAEKIHTENLIPNLLELTQFEL